jgi:hypothetical protein
MGRVTLSLSHFFDWAKNETQKSPRALTRDAHVAQDDEPRKAGGTTRNSMTGAPSPESGAQTDMQVYLRTQTANLTPRPPFSLSPFPNRRTAQGRGNHPRIHDRSAIAKIQSTGRRKGGATNRAPAPSTQHPVPEIQHSIPETNPTNKTQPTTHEKKRPTSHETGRFVCIRRQAEDVVLLLSEQRSASASSRSSHPASG